jgi:predicted  nucleic acid-binding Zn-ribbon protein
MNECDACEIIHEYDEKLDMYRDQINEWKEAYDTKTRVHNALNLDYIELRENISKLEKEKEELKEKIRRMESQILSMARELSK